MVIRQVIMDMPLIMALTTIISRIATTVIGLILMAAAQDTVVGEVAVTGAAQADGMVEGVAIGVAIAVGMGGRRSANRDNPTP
jgi:hypothetical protein